MKNMEYHHLGIPNTVERENESYFEPCKMHHTNFDDNPYGIEWLRFQEGSPLPELVKQYPHLGFKVDDLDAAIEGQKILIEPNCPSDGVRVAFIEYKGAPVEFLEYDESQQVQNFPELQTQRLRLRKFCSSDAKTLFKMRTDPTLMEFMDVPMMVEEKDAKKSIDTLSRRFIQQGFPMWALALKDSQEDRMIGYVGYTSYMKNHCRAEVGYLLDSEFWGKGYMSEAFQAILEYGFETMNLHSIEANVSPANKASIKLLERFSFVREAYYKENWFFNGKFMDSAIYSLLKRNFSPIQSGS